MRGAQKRKLRGGASNDILDHNRVYCSLIGDEAIVDEMLDRLRAGCAVNSWNARVEILHLCEHFIDLSEHQVTTDNVNRFNWSSNVEFYL